MHYEILDTKRKGILAKLSHFKERFYLAGGTGLALQIGHRDSIDFDFFTPDNIETQKLYFEIRELCNGIDIIKTQEENNTLSIIIDAEIKISFLKYPYPVIEPYVEDEYFRIASILDIACMKLSAIVGRSVIKDYIDLYFILQSHSLPSILAILDKKMPDLDRNLVLKSLVYFNDITSEPIIFKNGNNVSLDEIKRFLVHEVKDFSRK